LVTSSEWVLKGRVAKVGVEGVVPNVASAMYARLERLLVKKP